MKSIYAPKGKKLVAVLASVGCLSISAQAMADSSVDLYGSVNIGYDSRGDNLGWTQKAQQYRYSSRIGIKGREDIGHGLAGIFKLEGEYEPDTGSGNYGEARDQFGFNREAWVGLVTPVGAFRFGRSTTPFVNMWMGGNFAPGRGVGEIQGGLLGGGLTTYNPEVNVRWNNAMFYDIKKPIARGELAAGLAVTTKGSTSETASPKSVEQGGVAFDNEGTTDGDPAYGAYARYEGKIGDNMGFKIGGAYQRDNGSSYGAYGGTKNANAEGKSGYLLALGYMVGPVEFDLGYDKNNIDNSELGYVGANGLGQAVPFVIRTADSNSKMAALRYKFTDKATVYASYAEYERENNMAFPYTGAPLSYGTSNLDVTQISVGGEYNLSKRTMLYADARRLKAKTNTCTPAASASAALVQISTTYCAGVVNSYDTALKGERGYGYSVGINHTF